MAEATASPNYTGQLTANTVDTITMDRAWQSFKIITDGSARIDYTVDGSTPVVGGSPTGRVIAATVYEDSPPVSESAPVVVRLISAGTPQYSIVAVPLLAGNRTFDQ